MSLQKLPDAELVALALARNSRASAAFAALFERYHRKLTTYVRLQMRLQPSDTEDVLQEVFLTAWGKLRQLRETEKVFPWLVSVARNTALDGLRRQQRTHEITNWLGISQEESYQPNMSAPSELAVLLAHCPEQEREAILLKELLELTFGEMAELLGIGESAAKMRYYRALETLRTAASTHP